MFSLTERRTGYAALRLGFHSCVDGSADPNGALHCHDSRTRTETRSGKRIAKVRVNLTKRTVAALEPADKSWIAWDDRLTGFGCRVQPSGTKSFIVNCRPGDVGRKAPNKRVVIGRFAPD